MPKVTSKEFRTTFATFTEAGLLGQGGSGVVYAVKDEGGESLALKLLHPSRITRERVKRFRNEIAFCERNSHPNILTVQDHGFSVMDGKQCPFYIMPRYPHTLRTLLEDGLAADRVLPLFSQLLDGVEAAHMKHVWHRDLKPENMLYSAVDDRLVVADFGIAHFNEDLMVTNVETKPSSRMANFEYAAPEQRRPGGSVNQRADIFSLGLILNEMLTGKVIQGTGFRMIGDEHPQYGYLDELVEWMVRQEPDLRPKSIDEIKRQLIARKNEFVSRQRISELSETVVRASSVDDLAPEHSVVVAETDWREGRLSFRLEPVPSSDWMHTFQNIDYRNSLLGKDPRSFQISHEGGWASIDADESEVVQVASDFEKWVGMANHDLKALLERSAREQERRERERLQDEVQEEEKRQRVLRSLRPV